MSKKVLSLVMVIGVMGAFVAGCSKPADEAPAATGTAAPAATDDAK